MLLVCCGVICTLVGVWQVAFLRVMDFYNLEAYSLADTLIIVASPPFSYKLYGILLAPLAIILLMCATEYDYSSNQVIRQQLLSQIWARQCVKSLCVALTITAMIILATLTCGSLAAGSLISFDVPRSPFSF